MPKIDVTAAWKTCKSLMTQAREYNKSGYSQSKQDRNESQYFGEAQSDNNTDHVNVDAVPKEILNSIATSFRSVLDFIEMFLLQDDYAGLYGLILVDTSIDIDFNQAGLIDIKIKKHPYSITYNPFYAEQKSINEIIGYTINELIKLCYLHPVTYSKLNPENDPVKHKNLEIASSVSSTEIVYNDIRVEGASNRVKLDPKLYSRSDLNTDVGSVTSLKPVKHLESFEYYYSVADAYLPKDPPPPPTSNSNDGSSGTPIHQWEQLNNQDRENLESDIKISIKNAYNALSDKQRGYIPNSIKEQIEMLFAPPQLNWRQRLARFVGLIPSGHKKSVMRLNRMRPDRFDLRGTLPDKVVRLVIAIDTSGSMSSEDISYCLNEIFAIVKSYKTDITVIECDAEIGKIYKIKKPTDIQTSVSGRGGTSYIPVIDYINSHKFNDAVLIYFTDGYGDYTIPKPRTYRNLWVLTGGSSATLSLKNPYGDVTTLATDKKYNRRR